MSIPKKIAKIRKELNLTTEEFGKKLGVTGRMVARWENSTSKPTDVQINKIKEVYAVDLNEVSVKKVANNKDTIKSKEVEIESTKEEKNSLVKSEAKGLKILCKIISIFAKISKVVLMICIPFLVALMIISPVILNNLVIGDNYIEYKMPSGDILTIQGENVSLSGKYTIKYKDEITSGEIKYDVLGEVAKNIKDMNKTNVIVYIETIIVLGIASIILEIIFFTYLSRLFQNISDKTPFVEENVSYLRKMTNILITNLIVTFLLNFVTNVFVNTDIAKKISFTSIIGMMAFASLIYIFKYGCNLQKKSNSDIY